MRRLMIDMGASTAASTAMLVAMIVAGQLLTVTATQVPTDTTGSTSMSCLEQPLVPTGDTGMHSVARLCLTIDDVQPTVELADMTSGALYTAWLGYLEQPYTRDAGPCASAHLASRTETATPGRVDAAVATQDGQVLLSRPVPGLRPEGNTKVEILVVDHGQTAVAGAAARPRQLLSWDRAWSGLPAPMTEQSQSSSRLIGCAAFWIRGGAELTEH